MSKKKIFESITVRNYRKGDFRGILDLWVVTDLSRPERGDDEKVIEESIRMGGCMKVIEEKSSSRIIGTSWMTFDGRRIHLHHFGILPGYQGNGLARLLLAGSLEFARNKGSQVKLEVHRDNVKAISLYKKAGFRSLGNYDVYIIRDPGSII